MNIVPYEFCCFIVWLNERLKGQKRLFVIWNNNGLVSALCGQPHTPDTDTNTQTHCPYYANVSLSLRARDVLGARVRVSSVGTFSGIEDTSSWKPKDFPDRCALWKQKKKDFLSKKDMGKNI